MDDDAELVQKLRRGVPVVNNPDILFHQGAGGSAQGTGLAHKYLCVYLVLSCLSLSLKIACNKTLYSMREIA